MTILLHHATMRYITTKFVYTPWNRMTVEKLVSIFNLNASLVPSGRVPNMWPWFAARYSQIQGGPWPKIKIVCKCALLLHQITSWDHSVIDKFEKQERNLLSFDSSLTVTVPWHHQFGTSPGATNCSYHCVHHWTSFQRCTFSHDTHSVHTDNFETWSLNNLYMRKHLQTLFSIC